MVRHERFHREPQVRLSTGDETRKLRDLRKGRLGLHLKTNQPAPWSKVVSHFF